MTEKELAVLRQVLEALEQIDGIDTETECVTIDVGDNITALQAIIEQAAQPADWVWLADEDIAEAGRLNVEGQRMLPYAFARAIEAKLREKNVA